MAIKWLTYVYIRAGGESPACSAQSVPSDAELYLEEHVTALQSKGRSGASPPAEFLEPAHRQRFEDLLCGHEQQFLAAATSLAAQVQAGLHGGTTDGLFVGLNGDASGIAFASVLKLEVTEKHRGALQDVAGGKIAISTVQNLLDKPGDRQKGVVVPDPRPDSSLIVGDRLSETALFFLSAIGARQAQKPALAAVEMAKVFQEVAPDLAVAMVERLTTSEARTPQEFLGQERELSAATRAQVMEKLTQRTRPVQILSPVRGHNLKKRVIADGIVITGRVSDVSEKVTWVRRQDGGWRIQIDVDQEPRFDYIS